MAKDFRNIALSFLLLVTPLISGCSQLSNSFYSRSFKLEQQGDIKGALSNINYAILLNPENIDLYHERMFLTFDKINQKELSDKDIKHIKIALKDANKISELDPNACSHYHLKSVLKSFLGDNKGAIKDINLSIETRPCLNKDPVIINRGYALDYGMRAYFKSQLGDMAGACKDSKKAAELTKNDMDWTNEVINYCE